MGEYCWATTQATVSCHSAADQVPVCWSLGFDWTHIRSWPYAYPIPTCTKFDLRHIFRHHHHHHHMSVMELGHLLTRSGLTYLEDSSEVYHDSFCQLGNSVSLPWVIYSPSSSSSSYVCHGVRPLVDTFRSDVSRILLRGLPRFLLPVGE